MKQISNKKKRDKVGATLMLCFCLIALTSIFTIKSNISKIAENARDVTVSEQTEAQKNSDKDKKVESSTPKANKETSQASAKVPIVDSKSVPTPLHFSSPMISCSIFKEYSMNMVIYSTTLDQYMTHPGIDLKSSESNLVTAVASGTVTDIYTDDCYGVTVEVTHSNGLISKYSNLSSKVTCEKGDTVSQGQGIGTAGKTALYESSEEVHLHFELWKNGNIQDPTKYLSF